MIESDDERTQRMMMADRLVKWGMTASKQDRARLNQLLEDARIRLEDGDFTTADRLLDQVDSLFGDPGVSITWRKMVWEALIKHQIKESTRIARRPLPQTKRSTHHG
jgi:hypothetical protein